MRKMVKLITALFTCAVLSSSFLVINTISLCNGQVFFPQQECLIEPVVSPLKDHFLFTFNKAMVDNDMGLQNRGVAAVEKIRDAVLTNPLFEVHDLIEPAISQDEYEKDPYPFHVSQKIVFSHLHRYSHLISQSDTCFVYSNTHGVRNGFVSTEPWGGLMLDFDRTDMPHRGITVWPDYAQAVLQIPGETVVILVMSCYSGGFIDYLETIQEQWNSRREEGRNFLVISSQNNALQSGPVRIQGEVINPFTYSVQHAFLGEADGFEDEEKDGKVTIREFIQYVVKTTQHHGPKAYPQVIGSFYPDHILFSISENP
jgi:hypothetical protein